MELIANNSQSLLSFIGHACSNADRRKTAIDAYEFVLIESKAGQLSISGSNGSQTFTRVNNNSAIEAIGEGELCVEAGKFFSVIRALPKDQTVKLKALNGKDKAVVTSGRSKLQLKTINPDTYPKNEILIDQSSQFNVPSQNLITLLNDAAYASGSNDHRIYLNAVNLRAINNNLYAIASDGHRVSANKYQIDNHDVELNLLIPINAVLVFSKINEPTSEIQVTFNSTHAQLNWGGLIYTTSLIDASYPDVMGLMPKKCKSKVTTNRIEFLDALKRLLALVSDKKNPKIKLSCQDNLVKFQTIIDNEEDGLGEDIVSATLAGDVMDYNYGVNPKYLFDALNHMPTENVELLFTDKFDSFSVVPVGEHTTRALIMPVRV